MAFLAWLRRGWPLWLLAALVLLLRAAYWYTEAAWFASLGYSEVFWTRFAASALLWCLGVAASALVLGGNLALCRRAPRPRWALADSDGLTIGVFLWGALPWLVGLAAVGVGWWCQGLWREALSACYAVADGHVDPVFGRDVSFYMLQLPLWAEFQKRLMLLSLVAWVGLYLRYVELPRSGEDDQRISLESIPSFGRAHLSALGAVVLLLWAWGFHLTRYRLLTSARSAVVAGIGYTDAHVRLPMLTALVVLAVVCAGVLLANCRTRSVRRLFGTVFVFFALVAAGVTVPVAVQRLIVAPNEVTLEKPYLARCIEATRHALGLDALTVLDAPTPSRSASLPPGALRAVADLPLWSPHELSEQLVGTEALRTYYSFNLTDIDRYQLDGRTQPVGIMVREMQTDRLDPTFSTWVNRTLVYTHGYGAVMAYASGRDGVAPSKLLSGLPPTGRPDLVPTRPEVYYGETPAGPAITGLRGESTKEFDYPAGDRNVFSTYAGHGGVRLGGWFSRLAWAMRCRSVNLMLSGAVGPDSRLHWRRPVAERLEALAPFLDFDSDPFPVVAEGRLRWMADGYTVSGRYPYSWAFPLFYARALNAEQPEQFSRLTCNYARNSIKAVVDAYDGSVKLHWIDPACPLARTWARIFPRLFDRQPLPDSLRSHLRYPGDLFALQARAAARFHMTDPQVFYNAEDLWDVAHEEATVREADERGEFVFANRHERMLPYYLSLALPGESEQAFRLMLPFTPASSREAQTSRDNLTAYLTADCDPEHYGRLTLVRYPKGALVYGPLQVEARINQEPLISEQLTLWGQQGSQVLRGRLIVVPLGDTLLYVEPLFLTAERRGALPELQRVIVVYRDRVAMAPTVSEALLQATGQSPSPTADSGTRQRLHEADQALTAADSARRAGDLVGYGQAMERVRKALRGAAP